MKLRNLWMSLLAVAALSVVGCQEEERDLGLPEVKVDQTTLSFGAGIGSGKVKVSATRDWKVVSTVDWIEATPKNGVGYEDGDVTISVLENEGYDRTGAVRIDIGYDYKTIMVSQSGPLGPKTEGSGTLEDPFTVAGVVAYLQELGADVESDKEVYVKGIISAVTEQFSTQFGNGTFNMSDDGVSAPTFTAYRILYLGNKKWTSKDTEVKVGDEAIVYGKVILYRGNTPETVQKTGYNGYLYSLNGETAGGGGGEDQGEAKGTGTLEDPYNPAGAAQAVKDLAWTDKDNYETTETEVYVKGKISKIADKGTYNESGTFGNASFYITEDGESGTEFYAYRILYLGNKKFEAGQTDIKVGDEVIVYGKLMNYRGNTPETVSGSYLYSLNGNTGGDTPTPQPGGDITVATVAQIKDAPVDNEKLYQLTATIKTIKNATYGNLVVSDDTGDLDIQGLIKGTAVGANDKSFADLNLAVGDKITIVGVRQEFNGTPQLGSNNLACYFVSKGDGGDTPTPQPGGNGSGTLSDPYTPAGAIDAVKDLTWTSNTDYESTEEVYVKGKISKIANKGTYTEGGTYGNASFYITEDGESGTEFYAFRILYLGNKKFEAGQTDIKVGDEVIIYGKLMNYQGNTPETVANAAYLYSLNGDTGDGGGDTPQPPVTEGIRFVKANKIESGQSYLIVAAGKMAKPLDASKTYGYLNVDDATEVDGVITVADETNAFVFTEDGNGYSIKQSDGRYLYQKGTYNSFNVGTKEEAGLGWYVNVKEDGTFEIKNMDVEKYIQYSPSHTSYGSYADPQDGGVVPVLYVKEDSQGGGGDTPTPQPGGTVSFDTNNTAQAWVEDTDPTYGAGFSSTTQNIKIGYYKHTGSTTISTSAFRADHIRIYKNSVIVFTAPEGKKFKTIKMVAPTADNCVDMTGLEGGSDSKADTETLTMTWTGSAAKVILQASESQVRCKSVSIEFE